MFIKIVPMDVSLPCKFSVFMYEAKNYSLHKKIYYPSNPEKETKDRWPTKSGTILENDLYSQREKFEEYESIFIGIDTEDGYRTLDAPFSHVYILNDNGKTIDSLECYGVLRK